MINQNFHDGSIIQALFFKINIQPNMREQEKKPQRIND